MGTGDAERDDTGGGEVVEFGSPGGGRGPRWWWLLAIGVVVVAVIAVLAIRQQTEPAADPGPTPAATGAPTPEDHATTAPPLTPAPSRREKQPAGTAGSPEHRDLSMLHASSDFDLFVYGDGKLLRLQPAQNRMTVTTLHRRDQGTPLRIIVGADRVILQPRWSGSGVVVPAGKPAHRLGRVFGGDSAVFPGPDDRHLWVLGQANPLAGGGQGRTLHLVDLDGDATGTTLTLPGPLTPLSVQPDGQGYLLASGVGGVYDVRPGRLRRITTGVVLAIGPTRFLVFECDDQLRCETVAVDRDSGARHTVPREKPVRPLPFTVQLGADGVVSPDGRTAAVVTATGGRPALRLIDLDSGAVRRVGLSLGDYQLSTQGWLAWSPDSRWLYVANNSGLHVVDPRSGHAQAVALPVSQARAVAVRP